MKNKEEFIQLVKENKLVLYGAGNLSKIVKRILTNHGINISYFLDNNANNIVSVDNVPVFTLGNESSANKSDYIVIVSAYNLFFDLNQIRKSLTEHGYSVIYSFLDFYKFFADEIGDSYWLTGHPEKYLLPDEVVNVGKLFEDEKSRFIFETTVAARLQFNYDLLPTPSPIAEVYFPPDVPLNKASVFIDCGAFDGDTIALLPGFSSTIQHVIALEPDVENYKKLALRSKTEFSSKFSTITAIPCGCWSESKPLHFNSGLGVSSNVTESGTTFIQGVALDDIIVNIKPDYIKMDIEGAEYEALLGGKQLILKYQPDLAICLYHKSVDLLRIVKLLDEWNLNYSFYLRQYGFFGFDLVLYAVRKNIE